MSYIKEILAMISYPPLVESIVLILMLAVFVRNIIPYMMNVKTDALDKLSDFYDERIKSMSESLTELMEITNSMTKTISEQNEIIRTQGKKIAIINSKLNLLTSVLDKYNCDNAPVCDDRRIISKNVQDVLRSTICESCDSTECHNCPYY